MELNTTQQNLVNDFAKANRVSRTKTQDLVLALMAAADVPTKPVRRAGNAILALRKQFEELGNVEKITTLDVARRLNVDYLRANELVALLETDGTLVRDGKTRSEGKTMGRMAVAYTSAQ